MHHFACACPSHDALSMLTTLAAGRPILDMGSGNGYWSRLLSAYGAKPIPIDSQQSAWRVNWTPLETVISTGTAYLASHKGCQDAVLLMVYPIVGSPPGSFVRDMLRLYKGDTIAVVGTQNGNGYTAFNDMTFDAYMAKEQPGWIRVVQVPLPSFAGKDEALFVYQRGARAPQDA